jgi:hypothetical protein
MQTIRACYDTWEILRSWCPKEYSFAQFLDVIIRERLGDQVSQISIPRNGNEVMAAPRPTSITASFSDTRYAASKFSRRGF